MDDTTRNRPWVVDWYRPDPRRALGGVWGRGTAVLLSGLTLCVPMFAPSLLIPKALLVPLVVLGVLATGAAALYVTVEMTRLLSDDSALVLRSDALVHTRGARSVVLGWGDVMGAEATPEGTVRILRRHAEPHVIGERFLDADAGTVAERIEDVRRKALMGLLPARPPRA
ncbi:MAG: hypothetical protein ACQEXJ_18280 [Myxococcota bacterium]